MENNIQEMNSGVASTGKSVVVTHISLVNSLKVQKHLGKLYQVHCCPCPDKEKLGLQDP
jgi:hypothetical protein